MEIGYFHVSLLPAFTAAIIQNTVFSIPRANINMTPTNTNINTKATAKYISRLNCQFSACFAWFFTFVLCVTSKTISGPIKPVNHPRIWVIIARVLSSDPIVMLFVRVI